MWYNEFSIITYQVPLSPLQGSGGIVVARAGGQGKQDPLALSRPQFFIDHFRTWQGHPLPYGLGRVRLWSLCLIKYAHNGPSNERSNIGIPGLILQVKAFKFGAYVGRNLSLNIRSGFYHNSNFWRFLRVFHRRTLKIVGDWSFSKVVATFNQVGGSCNVSMATTGNVWIIPSFRIWGFV